METASIQVGKANLDSKISVCADINPDLAVVFSSPSILSDKEFGNKLKSKFANAIIIGCSTSGEIGVDGVSDDTISIATAKFSATELKSASADLQNAAESFAAGVKIAEELASKSNLKSVFTLCPGVNVNGSEFVKGLKEKLPAGVVITGGLAGDGVNFKQTYTMLNGEAYTNKVVAFGLYGDNISVGTGSRGGWNTFGPARKVTKSISNVLYELDGKPALQLYKEYLGAKAAELPSSGLLYPFAILREDRSTNGLIRTILDVDHAVGSLTLAGDLPEGSSVCLMHADTESLVNGSSDAAKEANVENSDDSLTLLVSCVGRKLIMGSDVDEEVEVVQDMLGAGGAIAGFYSYGEICPFAESGAGELHNQTMTITCITEKKVA
jgi:hypothetical protein